MQVSVGSRNPIKISAVESAFKKFFNNVKVISLKVKTSIPFQPIGINKTLIGALERAILSLNKSDYGVGIEAGLIKVINAGFMNLQICAIVDKNYKVTLGTSSAFEIPSFIVENILNGKSNEMEEEFERITGIKSIGDKGGAAGFLTKEEISRYDLCYEATIMALVPRINKKLYKDELPNALKLLSKLRSKENT